MRKTALACVMSAAACFGSVNVQAAPTTGTTTGTGTEWCQVGTDCQATLYLDVAKQFTITPITSGHQYVCSFYGQVAPNDNVTMQNYSFTPPVTIYLGGYPNVTNTSVLQINALSPFQGAGSVTFELKQKAHLSSEVHVVCRAVS